MRLNKNSKIFLKSLTIGLWGLLASMVSCKLSIPESFYNDVASNVIGAPMITYSTAAYSFVVNTVIGTETPTITATPLTSCVSSPTLPTGLSINATSCAISGTPTAVQSATSYTITASNTYSNGTANISIAVTAAGVAPTVSYTGSPFTFTQNTAITTQTPTLTGDAPTSCTSSPTLPTGLSINATSCAISGTSTSVQGATSYTITASNSGGNTMANISITVNVAIAAGTQYVLSTGGVFLNMRYIPGKTTFTGTTDATQATVTGGYTISEAEVTYQLWSVVYTWATANGYTFSNAGHQGGDINGCLAAIGTNQHPVTCINWRDAMVWSNALTEYYNVQNATSYAVVYTSDASYATPIRSSADGAYSTTANMTAGSFNNPYVNSNAKGFRLPTDAEWELAARYIADNNNDGDIMDAGEYYPGSHISGDITAGYSTSVVLGNYGWYSGNRGSKTNTVTTKTANALGLYDMSGNVLEWDYDWYPGFVGTYRMFRGGSGYHMASSMQVGKVDVINPYYENFFIGFRPARSP